jgi:toxin CptA
MLPLPLVVTISDSRQLRLYLLAAHICAAAAIVLANISPLVQIASGLVLAGSLIYYWRPRAEVRLRGDDAGNLQIWQEQKWQSVNLANSSVILPACTVLCLKLDKRWRKLNLVILPDSLSVEAFRQLRVWLRWRAGKAELTKAAAAVGSQKEIQ